MERLNFVNRLLSKENNVSRNVCVNSANRIVQEICCDNGCKISNSHDLSSDNLNKTLKPEECVSACQCDKPSGYVFVDVGSDLIGSGYLLEEDDDICKASSETVFTDSRDIDYNLVKNVNVERFLKNPSKENEMNNYNLETNVFNISDVYTGSDRSGLLTSTCIDNMYENLDNYNKKPSIDIDYTTTSTAVSASGGFEKVNACVKKEKSVEDILVYHSTENMSPEIKKEEMVYNDEVSILNESIIDIKVHPVNKVEEPPDIGTNYSSVLDENSKTRLIVLSKTVNSGFQEVHTEYSEEVPDNSDVADVKPLKENETVQRKRESHLNLQNNVQTRSRTRCELQIKPKTNSGDDTGTDGVEECNNKLIEEDLNTETKNKNDETYQHHRNRMSKHKKDRRYVCEVCCKCFTQLSYLKDHKRIHTGERPFGCSTCGKAFTQLSHLTRHLSIHTGDRPFGCDTCGRAFRQLGDLKSHIRIHTGERPFGCRTCGKAFKQLAHRNDHERIHTGDKSFCCSTCGKAFINKSDLRRHIHIHSSDNPFCCNTCGSSFTRLAGLKSHKRIHTGDRPYVCSTCGKAFTRLAGLKSHKHIHTGDRPYVCSTCGKAFTQLCNLKTHKHIHNGEKPFVCSTCGKAFTHTSSLKKHKQVHSKKESLNC